ncbi:MAG: hypothetical protein FVQ84_00370 [Planctomycetes bacterium]|nr:hypothetical protein [Planctomycetota bacterium]
MIEKIKHIRNPLTIVAVFVAIAEIVGTVSLTTLNERHHIVIVWFLVLFPTLLVVLFFFTLWHKPWVLIFPSDFKEGKDYLKMLTIVQRLSLELYGIDAQIQNSNKKIINGVLLCNNSQKENTNRISEILNNETAQMIGRINFARSSLEQYAMSILPHALPQSRLQHDIFHELRKSPEALSFSQICEKIKRDRTEIKKAFDRMVQRHIIKTINRSDGISYILNL